jgi:heme-degrading monooxygenase HmoA
MIIRQWRGVARRECEAVYKSHFNDEVLPKLRQLGGFRGATILRREMNEGVEVTVLTRWESMDAIRAFAGENADVAVVAPSAQRLFVSFDKSVTHHEVVAEKSA